MNEKMNFNKPTR